MMNKESLEELLEKVTVNVQFEFEIDGVKKIVQKGDTMLKTNDVVHGCVCLEAGVLLDIFNPYRKDFVED